MPRSILLPLHSFKLAVIGIGRRPAPYISAFVGFLIVMVVSTAALGIFNGLQTVINKSGSDDIAVIWASQGGISEDIVRDLYQIDAVARNKDRALLMRSFSVPIQVFLDGREQLTSVGFFGVDANFQDIWNNIHVSNGQAFRPGTNEIMVGQRLFEASPDALAPGKTIDWNHQTWKIVGVFVSNGDRRESQIIGDQINLRAAYNESEYSDIYVRLNNKDGIQELTDLVGRRYGSNIAVQSERELLGQAGGTVKFIILIIGSITVGLMAFGAVIGGVNIISMIIADKTREIGMLKALGFNKSFIFFGVLGESLLISLPSAAIAFLTTRIIMQGKIISTSSDSGNLLSFDLNFDASIFAAIMAFGFLLGLVGGLTPAIRAVSIRPTDAMNAIE